MPVYQSNKWVVIPRPNPAAKIKLFCLPFAGGSSVAFRNWANILPDFVEVNAIEIPGRGHRLAEPLIKVLDNLVYSIARGLEDQIDKPFAIFGHSMGALVGYELAHYLKNHFNAEAVHLFFSGRGAPHLDSKEKPIHNLSEYAFIEEIKNYNGTPKEVLEHAELMQIMVPILRADFQVCETYVFRKPRFMLESPLTIFSGLNDPSAPKPELEAWRDYSSGKFQLRMFPGDHFYLNHEEKRLLEAIARDLNTSAATVNKET